MQHSLKGAVGVNITGVPGTTRCSQDRQKKSTVMSVEDKKCKAGDDLCDGEGEAVLYVFV